MLHPTLQLLVSLLLMQAPPQNAACAVLTPAQVSSLIGSAQTIPMGAAPNGATCMFQNHDRVITVLMATVSSADGAQGLFNSKKRIVAGTDMQGWAAPAYAGIMRPDASVVGVLRKQTLVEVKVIDPTQAPGAVAPKLQAVMKDVAARK